MLIGCRVRLPSLYSDFRRLKQLNPEGFYSNVRAWEGGLRDAAKRQLLPGTNDTLSVTLSPALTQTLECGEYGRPLAVGAAIVSGFLPLLPLMCSG